MRTQILTSKFGGELISFRLNGEERIHQGENCVDKKRKSLLEKTFTNIISYSW